MAPGAKTTAYAVPGFRSALGSTFSVFPVIVMRELFSALKTSTSVPVAFSLRNSMVPLPRRIDSENVNRRSVPSATAVAPDVGAKVVTVGAELSIKAVSVLKFQVEVPL